MFGASMDLSTAWMRYANEFTGPYMNAMGYFDREEQENPVPADPMDQLELLGFNLDLGTKALIASGNAITDFGLREFDEFMKAILNTTLNPFEEEGGIVEFWERQAERAEMLAHGYPKLIEDIGSEFGFGFERGENEKIMETDRFVLFRIAPTISSVEIREDSKPVLIIPPFVLGANILAFLPGENRSYAHSFANQGIPTYIRIVKEIAITPAVQKMTPEDNARDTRFFCEELMRIHGKPVTLNGYCQGGLEAVANLLSGELDGVVDALITCVAPMDGTRSKGLNEGFLGGLPDRFNSLAYGTKKLPNGNEVADGELMGWIYRLKSIEREAPPVAFFRDLTMLGLKAGKWPKISKSIAAINFWLKRGRRDIPLGVTGLSFASYTIPVTEDGMLPFKLFGRTLNFKRIAEKKIPWLLCYGKSDDLVEEETALAPLDHLDCIEVTPFPRGHVAIATSWSDPTSACALHTRFGEGNWRGPVRFQLDLDLAMRQSLAG